MIDYTARFRITNKVACVTGGVGLVGLQISTALACAGGKVIILDKDENRGLQEVSKLRNAGYDVSYLYFDIADLEHVERILLDLREQYGSIDIWVNSAYPRTDDWSCLVEDIPLESWRKNIDIHLNGYAWTSRCVALTMRDQGGGAIVNLGSIYGVVGNDFNIYQGTDTTGPMAYSAVKGGIVNLGRYLAAYFGKYNIRVNTVCPGGIFDNQDPVFVERYCKNTLLNRMGRPDEIASVVLFLVAESAAYITGATVMVDGGWTAI
jgi:NAD(P)-dependent dehydrogenase (short-subunit alcohol dehydrogenase family)